MTQSADVPLGKLTKAILWKRLEAANKKLRGYAVQRLNRRALKADLVEAVRIAEENVEAVEALDDDKIAQMVRWATTGAAPPEVKADFKSHEDSVRRMLEHTEMLDRTAYIEMEKRAWAESWAGTYRRWWDDKFGGEDDWGWEPIEGGWQFDDPVEFTDESGVVRRGTCGHDQMDGDPHMRVILPDGSWTQVPFEDLRRPQDSE